jgi:hypothetical protein
MNKNLDNDQKNKQNPMKNPVKKLAALLLFAFLITPSVRATVLFHDALNYPNGLIETDGLWQVYAPFPPAAPYGDCFVSNNLIQLVKGNHDAIDAPFTNNTGNTLVYASFTINVTSLPTSTGSYFAEFQDPTDYADVAHLFAATQGTSVPGTYRLGMANYATVSSSASFFPLDLATNTTYYVVMSYDPNQSDPFPGATMVVNPASETDFDNSPAYGRDNSPTSYQLAVTNSAIAVSPYVTAGIGSVYVATTFSEVFPLTPSAPVIAFQPQPASIYSGNGYTLYTAASGLGTLTYQWYANNVPLSDGANVNGSLSNILKLSNLQVTANYSVTVTGPGGSTPSLPATVTVNNTPTAPFFTTEPYGATNGNGSTITLSAVADGTGPLSYQWYFEATNANTFTSLGASGTAAKLTLSPANYSESGSYYLTVTNTAGATNSVTNTVLVTPPPLVTLGFLRSMLSQNNVVQGASNLSGGEFFTVQGIVTSIGMVETKTYSEYFIQDATGAGLAFVNGTGNTNSPPVGSLVQFVGIAQDYYGELELAPIPSTPGAITIISTNNPLPAPVLLNLPTLFASLATTNMTPYAISLDGSLVTLPNVYLYSSTNGAAVSGNFPTNSTKTLYAFSGPYSAGAPYVTVYQSTYTNIYNQFNTNFWGKPIPSQCFELTGAIDYYNPATPELIVSRYQDYVTTSPAPFSIGLSSGNGSSTITWPALVGSTYSVYSAPTVTGPWTQTFGLSYYPSTGTYTVPNAAVDQFFKVTTP